MTVAQITPPAPRTDALAGHAYGLPVVRPACAITDAYARWVPADRIWSGLPTARWKRRAAFRTAELLDRIPSE